jgi:serine phosphatase RsbU (regulator of sigma subunit)
VGVTNTSSGGWVNVSGEAARFERGLTALTTAAVMAFYTQDSQLYFSGAGHPTPFRRTRSERTWQPLSLTGTDSLSNRPLGAFLSTTYEQAITPLQKGDRIVHYTDGVTESFSEGFEEFGEERFRKVLQEASDHDLTTIKGSLLDPSNLHTNGMPGQDDLTLLLIEGL